MTLPTVGKIFEVAINDVGYMLMDTEAEQYRRLVSRLEPDRFSSGSTPVSESFDRYQFFNSSEWRGGAGQKFLNRQASDQSSFWDSEGIDPFCECQRLHLLPSMNFGAASAVADAMAVAGSQYLLLRDSGNVEQHTIATDTVTAGNVHTITTVTDMDIAIGKGFIATGTNLEEIDLGAAGETERSALDVHRVEWIGDRIAVMYRDSATSTWRFSTLDTAGTEEISGGLLTLPGATNADMSLCDTKLGGITHGINYVWFSSWTEDGDEAHIYVWNIDTTLSPYVALQMPKGETPIDIYFYQGALYVWASSANSGVAKVYRCIVNGDGTLTPFLIVTDAGTAPAANLYDGPKFAASGRQVFFAWNDMQTNGGFGVIELSTGGYAKRGHAGNTGEVTSVFVFGNRPGLSVASRGFWTEHSFVLESTGFLRTSIVDADSALDKRWTSLSFNADQTVNTDVDISYTLDGGDSYVAAITNSALEEVIATLGVEGFSIGLQMQLDGDASDTPYLRIASAKFHPLGIIDEILMLPLDCSDRVEGLNGADLGYTPDSGRARARALQELQGNYVTVQDIDWPETNVTADYELIQVDIRRMKMARDASTASNRSTQVAVCSLRRDISVTAASAPGANNAPVIDDPGAQGDTINVPLTLQLTATDSDSDALTWGASTLPTGLTCDQNGRITGTPTVAGVFNATVYASDQVATDTQAIAWTIT